jgi:hypothetical protein
MLAMVIRCSVSCADTKANDTPGAVRIERQFYELGQVCANACDIALTNLDTPLPVQDVSYDGLRERLLEHGAILDVSLVGQISDFSFL